MLKIVVVFVMAMSAALTASAPAGAQSSRDRAACANEQNAFSLDMQISGCTALITSYSEGPSNRIIAYYLRGSAYDAKGDHDRAIADFNKAIELNPNYAAAYTGRGSAYVAKNDNDRAIADLNNAIRLNPKDTGAYGVRGIAYGAKGDNDRAIADYSSAIRLDAKGANAFVYAYRGNAYHAKGDKSAAIADITKAVELNPKMWDWHRQLGVLRFDTGNFKGAADSFQRAIEMEADSYAMLYRYLARSRGGDAAGPELESNAGRLKTKEWPYAVIELYLGRRAPEATLAAAGKPGDRCEAQFYIGEWHILKGDSTAATASLKVAVDTCPKNFLEYKSAVAELDRLKR